MKSKSIILATATIFTGILISGCGSTKIITNTQPRAVPLPPPPPPIVKQKIKKVETTTGVAQHGPNIYKSASAGSCSGASCVTPKYDVTQESCCDYPVSYRAKREVIEKDVILVKE